MEKPHIIHQNAYQKKAHRYPTEIISRSAAGEEGKCTPAPQNDIHINLFVVRDVAEPIGFECNSKSIEEIFDKNP